MSVLYLTEDEVGRVLTMDLALDGGRGGVPQAGAGRGRERPPAAVPDRPRHAARPAGRGQDARRDRVQGVHHRPKPGAKFHVTLFDPKTGAMTALIEADLPRPVSAPGAASGVATKKLARPDAATVGLFGTGKQARTQLLAVCKVRPIKRVHVYGRDADTRKAVRRAR